MRQSNIETIADLLDVEVQSLELYEKENGLLTIPTTKEDYEIFKIELDLIIRKRKRKKIKNNL